MQSEFVLLCRAGELFVSKYYSIQRVFQSFSLRIMTATGIRGRCPMPVFCHSVTTERFRCSLTSSGHSRQDKAVSVAKSRCGRDLEGTERLGCGLSRRSQAKVQHGFRIFRRALVKAKAKCWLKYEDALSFEVDLCQSV